MIGMTQTDSNYHYDIKWQQWIASCIDRIVTGRLYTSHNGVYVQYLRFTLGCVLC